jgi:hypothetical protein
MVLIYKGIFALSKNMAPGGFGPVFTVKAGLSTALCRPRANRFPLWGQGRISAHFMWIRLLARRKLRIQVIDL